LRDALGDSWSKEWLRWCGTNFELINFLSCKNRRGIAQNPDCFQTHIVTASVAAIKLNLCTKKGNKALMASKPKPYCRSPLDAPQLQRARKKLGRGDRKASRKSRFGSNWPQLARQLGYFPVQTDVEIDR